MSVLVSYKVVSYMQDSTVLRQSADSIFALQNTNKTGKTNIQKGGVNRWSNKFWK